MRTHAPRLGNLLALPQRIVTDASGAFIKVWVDLRRGRTGENQAWYVRTGLLVQPFDLHGFTDENVMEGSLPSELGHLTTTDSLEMVKNSFTGSLPTQVRSLYPHLRISVADDLIAVLILRVDGRHDFVESFKTLRESAYRIPALPMGTLGKSRNTPRS